ncbi:MAG: hypothetical protein JWM36_3014 [Hyphomicrobiales bacterium]|nr:hypothetical protein [Hyphomicrobiales bacterium]
MPRFYFDASTGAGAVVHDTIGVIVSDAAAALHECIDAVTELPAADITSITVKNENGDVLMILNVGPLTVPRAINC